jgi:hypothetical protein
MYGRGEHNIMLAELCDAIQLNHDGEHVADDGMTWRHRRC